MPAVSDVGAPLRVVVRVTGPRRVELRRSARRLEAELSDGLEDPVPTGRFVELGEVLVDEVSQRVDDGRGVDVIVGGHVPRGIRGERRTELVGFGTLGNQFSEAAARVELINHRKATGERFQRVFSTELEAERARAQAFVDRNQKLALDLVQLGVQDDLETRLVTLTEAPVSFDCSTFAR